MPKKNAVPDPSQLNLLADRSRLIRLLRDFELLRTPAQKLMLMELDYHIGKYDYIELSIDKLAPQCVLSRTSAYRVKDELQEMGLIVAKSIGARKFRWSIGWSRMSAMHAEGSEATTDEGIDDADETLLEPEICLAGKTGHLAHETVDLTHKMAHPTGETGHLAHETSRLTSKAHIRNIDLSSIQSSISSSTTSSDDDAARRTVVVRLMDCGVSRIGETADLAIANGMTFDQIHAVIDHYQAAANTGRWSPNMLVVRLTRPDMHLAAADQCWPDGSPEWLAAQKRKAQAEQTRSVHQQLVEATQRTAKPTPEAEEAAELEAAYGPTLDAMTAEERKGLVGTLTTTMQQWIAKAGNDAHKSKLYRKSFLQALKARANQ